MRHRAQAGAVEMLVLFSMLMPRSGHAALPARAAGLAGLEKEMILEATRIEDPEILEETLGGVLHHVLTEGDTATYLAVCDFLDELELWFDFEPFAWIGVQEKKARGSTRFLSMLDRQSRRRMGYKEKVSLLRDALLLGEAAYGRNESVISRYGAIKVVAQEGVLELKELAEQQHRVLSEVYQKSYPLERFRLELSLTSGASTIEQALLMAAQRLQEMDACKLRHRMQQDELFFEVTLELTRLACRRSPIDGHQLPACQKYYEIFAREWRRGPDPALDTAQLFPPNWLAYFAQEHIGDSTFHETAARQRQRQLAVQTQLRGLSTAEALKTVDLPPCLHDLEQARSLD